MSWTKNNRIRCDICGKLMGYHEWYTWTPYGSCMDLEPPDSQEAHVRCYEGMTEAERHLTERISWIKPYIYNATIYTE